MIESQKTVCDWADATFGHCTNIVSIERMLKEVDELKLAMKEDPDDFHKISNECADILITLYRIADCYGFDLRSCVDHKMDINRHRKWKSNGDGTGQHIKE